MNNATYRARIAKQIKVSPKAKGEFRLLRPSLPPLVWWMCLISAGVLLILPFGSFRNLPAPLVIWLNTGLLLGLWGYGFKLSQERGENPWVSPSSLLMLFYFFRYGWGILVAYYWDSFPWTAYSGIRGYFLRHGVKNNLPNACQLLMLGGLGLFMGTALPAGFISRLLPPLRWSIDEIKFKRNLVVYTPFGLLVYGLLWGKLPQEFQYAISLFGWVNWVMIIIASYWLFSSSSPSERNKWILFLGFFYICSFAAALTFGMVGHFLFPGLFILFGYILARGSFPKKFILIAIPLMFFFILPWTSIYKQSAKKHNSKVISAVSEQFSETDYRTRLELSMERFFSRLSGALHPGVFSQYYPEIYPFEDGKTFQLELMAQIPRIFWPEKPNLSLQLNYYTHIVGLLPDLGKSSGVMCAITEYYINFGLIGVLILSIVHGYYLNILFDWLVRRSDYVIGASIFLVLFLINLDFSGIVALLVRDVRMLSVWTILLYFLSRRS